MQYELLKKRIGPASDQLRPTDRTKSAKGIGSGHLEHQTLVLYCPSSEPPLFAADSQEWQPLPSSLQLTSLPGAIDHYEI